MQELIQHLHGSYSSSPSNGSAASNGSGSPRGNAPSKSDASSNGQRRPAPDLQPDLRGALSRVTHDINNPLSIISGNAQLLLELSRALDLDPDVAKPIRDIEEASQRLARMIERLNALNDTARQSVDGRSGV